MINTNYQILITIDPDPMEPPSAILWVWFFLAQHFDKCGDHRRALEYIDKSIDHTPTHIELYMLKSKIYKVRTEKLCTCTD